MMQMAATLQAKVHGQSLLLALVQPLKHVGMMILPPAGLCLQPTPLSLNTDRSWGQDSLGVHASVARGVPALSR